MTKKEEITTVAQHHYDEFASEFTSKETDGVNSLLTPSPQGDHKKHCAKLNWWVDAVAKAQKEYRRKQILKMNKDILTWLENTEIIRKGYTNLSLYYLKRLASLSPF